MSAKARKATDRVQVCATLLDLLRRPLDAAVSDTVTVRQAQSPPSPA